MRHPGRPNRVVAPRSIVVDLASKCYLVELLQDGFVNTLANNVGLRMTNFGFECSISFNAK